MAHFRISKFLILQLIKFVKPDSAFYSLFKAIFSFLPSLIKNAGIVPVAYTILILHSFISKGLPFKKFPTKILAKLNPYVFKTIWMQLNLSSQGERYLY